MHFSTHDLIRWLLYAIIIAVPFGVGEVITLRVLTLMIVAIWGLQIFAQSELVYRRSPLNRGLLAYAMIAMVGLFFSPHRWVSFFGKAGEFWGLMTVLNLIFVAWVALNFFP